MIHPLILLAARHPDLLAEHGEAYVALVGKEISQWRASLVRRMVMGVVAGVCGLISLIFIGVALMLWGAATPNDALRAPWALFAPPAVMLVITVVAAFIAAKGGTKGSVFAHVKAQVHADLAMLREVNSK